jgi:hypothetical protein
MRFGHMLNLAVTPPGVAERLTINGACRIASPVRLPDAGGCHPIPSHLACKGSQEDSPDSTKIEFRRNVRSYDYRKMLNVDIVLAEVPLGLCSVIMCPCEWFQHCGIFTSPCLTMQMAWLGRMMMEC